MAALEVVENDDLMAVRDQQAGDDRADIAGATGDESFIVALARFAHT